MGGRAVGFPVRTLILDPVPAELRDLLDRRRRSGADRHDEVWQGVRHIVPAPGAAHSLIAQQLAILLDLGRQELADRIDWPPAD
ncbi:MAG: hypothetical protein QOD61_2147 [Solirubrobacteraceae bacterium]|jgi:hypothetical protein|nr:hypothetical protein [Solirubrobacteraceae bacterium]MEA2356018.1 hypothetical protein [Solirubrobacteraceae bacterium]